MYPRRRHRKLILKKSKSVSNLHLFIRLAPYSLYGEKLFIFFEIEIEIEIIQKNLHQNVVGAT